MVVLHALLGTASFAGLAAAVAMVPQPSTGQVRPSSQVKREINRMDIIRRASHMMKKRQGPSAMPIPPAARCGDFVAGQQFFVTIPNPQDARLYSYISTSVADIDEYGFAPLAFTEDELAATPFVFNDGCEITATGNINEGRSWVDAARTYDEVRMGTEGYIGQEGGNTVACINQDGNLRCGTAEGWLPIDETIFCMSTSGTLQLTSSDPATYGCTPIALSLSSSPPPQPVIPTCGDYPIGTPMYLSALAPALGGSSLVYGHVEDVNINFGFGSEVFTRSSDSEASAFMFDENCALSRVTFEGTTSIFTVGVNQASALIVAQREDAIGARDRLHCISNNGFLQCDSAFIPVAESRFCLFSRNYFMLARYTPSDCPLLEVAISRTLPPVAQAV